MKLAILLARSTADSGHASVVGAPMPYAEAVQIFKDHVARREMPDGCAAAGFNVLELWTAAGRQKHKRVANLDPAPAPVEEAGVSDTSDTSDTSGQSDQSAAPSQPALPVEAPAKPTEGDPVEKMAARIEAEGAVSAEDLATLTVAQLKTLATRYELAIPGDATKAQIIEIFLAPEE